MNREKVYASIHDEVEFSFARSGGPGGQNVNKVNTKVIARLDISRINGLSESEILRIKEILSSRLVEDQILQIHVSDERSQLSNRQIAIQRLTALICGAAVPPKTRKPSKPTRSSIEKRLLKKKTNSIRKAMRSGKIERE